MQWAVGPVNIKQCIKYLNTSSIMRLEHRQAQTSLSNNLLHQAWDKNNSKYELSKTRFTNRYSN